jgi:hypothetical protein
LAEPFIGKLKNLSRRYCKISRSRAEQNPEKPEQNARGKNKTNKSFVLSWGRKLTTSYPVFKPPSLPDFQNANDTPGIKRRNAQ